MSRDNYLIRMDVWLQLRYLSGCPVRGQLLNLDGCPGPSLICMDVQDISLISLSPTIVFLFNTYFLFMLISVTYVKYVPGSAALS